MDVAADIAEAGMAAGNITVTGTNCVAGLCAEHP